MSHPGLSGKQHHGNMAKENIGFDLPADIVPIHFRHLDVQEHDIGGVLAELSDRFFAIMGDDHVIFGTA